MTGRLSNPGLLINPQSYGQDSRVTLRIFLPKESQLWGNPPRLAVSRFDSLMDTPQSCAVSLIRYVPTILSTHNPTEWLLCASSLCGRLWPIAAEPEITMSSHKYAIQEFCRSIENCWQNLVRSPQNRSLYKYQSSRSNGVHFG